MCCCWAAASDVLLLGRGERCAAAGPRRAMCCCWAAASDVLLLGRGERCAAAGPRRAMCVSNKTGWGGDGGQGRRRTCCDAFTATARQRSCRYRRTGCWGLSRAVVADDAARWALTGRGWTSARISRPCRIKVTRFGHSRTDLARTRSGVAALCKDREWTSTELRLVQTSLTDWGWLPRRWTGLGTMATGWPCGRMVVLVCVRGRALGAC